MLLLNKKSVGMLEGEDPVGGRKSKLDCFVGKLLQLTDTLALTLALQKLRKISKNANSH